jgi:hypothetical protein
MRTFLRYVVTSTLGPLSVGQLTLLGSLGVLIWGWWRTWNERQRGFDDVYRQMYGRRDNLEALDEIYSRYQKLRGVFPVSVVLRDPRIEDLRHTVKAEECLHRAIESLENSDFDNAQVFGGHLFAWDRTHWAVPVLGCLSRLLSGGSPAASRSLEQLRRGWGQAQGWPKLRRLTVRALSRIPLADARRFLEHLHDPDPGVRIEITWVRSGKDRPSDLDERLKRLISASPCKWLGALGDPPEEVQDPFGAAAADSADLDAEPIVWEHPLYEQLYVKESITVLAPAGGGKTTARLALKRRFWGTSDIFVLEYTDFHRLVLHPDRITARRHIDEVVRCAARAVAELLLAHPQRLAAVRDHRTRRLTQSLLANHLSDPRVAQRSIVPAQNTVPSPDERLHSLLSKRPPAEAMCDLVAIVQELGFDELYLLVDRLNNLPEARDTTVVEALLRHPLNDPAFLDVPHLHVKLFLPAEWKEIVVSSSGVCSGRMHLRELQWDEESLLAMLKERLQVAGVQSLNRLAVDDIYPLDLDAELAGEANGSPRRLVELGETLLRLRALGWEESAYDSSDARLRTEDWAAMLEYGLRRD